MSTLGWLGASICLASLVVWLLIVKAGDAAREKWRRIQSDHHLRKAGRMARRMARSLPSAHDMDEWVRPRGTPAMPPNPRARDRDGD